MNIVSNGNQELQKYKILKCYKWKMSACIEIIIRKLNGAKALWLASSRSAETKHNLLLCLQQTGYILTVYKQSKMKAIKIATLLLPSIKIAGIELKFKNQFQTIQDKKIKHEQNFKLKTTPKNFVDIWILFECKKVSII